jgi:hypothetical protein
VEHRVRSGETLESIASANGLTWRLLARFNFGTDRPPLLNAALQAYVGCTRRTADGKSFVFDDTDDPGLIYLPRVIPAVQVSTGAATEVRVKKPPFAGTIEIQTVDEQGLPVGGVAVMLEPIDGGEGAQEVALTTDDRGYGRTGRIPAGAYRVRRVGGGSALHWRGNRPGDVRRASADELTDVHPAVVSTLHRDCVASILVDQGLSPDARAARRRLRDAYAFNGTAARSRPRGSSIDEATGGNSIRTLHVCADTLFLCAGWTDDGLSTVDLDRLLTGILPEWLDDHCPVVKERGYYTILLDDRLGKLNVRTAQGASKGGPFDLRGEVQLLAPFGAYGLFAAGGEEPGGGWSIFLDIASRSFTIGDANAPGRSFSLREIVDPGQRGRWDEVVGGFGAHLPVVLSTPTGKDLYAIALAGGSGLLEEYGASSALNTRVHGRNIRVCKKARQAYEHYREGYLRAVRKCESESELRALGPPLSPYEFPAPPGATSDRIVELFDAAKANECEAWNAVAAQLDRLAGRKSEGLPFIRFRVKYAVNASKAGELEGLRPDVAELAKYAPLALEIEGNLELQLRDGVEVIKKGTTWKAEVKVEEKLDETAKALVRTAGGNAVLVTANGTPRAIFDGALGRTRVQGDVSTQHAKLNLDRGDAKAELELAEDKVKVGVDVAGKGLGGELSKDKASVKLGAYQFELKATGESKLSVDLGGAVVDTRWAPRSAEMTAGVTLPLGKLANKLQAMGGKAAKHGKALDELKWLEVGAEIGLAGSREETALAVFARTRGFFQRRSLTDLFRPETQWSGLTLDEVTSLANLGWTRESWDQKYDPHARRLPASCDKGRDALSAVEKIAIVDLGFHAYEDYGKMVHDQTDPRGTSK